ncbi:hypothetical protein AJ80_06242 [Polytolypa hystricis UAMH7299]|uniref:Box C/D snoRNA protein 1 n=1 Tax=Polytolypa hystricis (strain UAMH7299) TaxID=1447883 RepID=A0A2B7XXW1_POLH7|nr:hypothetical protein AJ80_06242 [Polytolypa hystricis UAMH7299]
MDNEQDLSLNELCKICHTNAPKYKCPRCSMRTCSLPCSKRHKLWSQCSGERDPAAYLKRKDLATPAAFDRDFNFISGIERYLERADRDAENRGVALDRSGEDGNNNGRGKRRGELVKGEVALQRALEASGVNVLKAPKGMTRNKQNMTYWHKRQKCLSWSIEWVLSDGRTTVSKSLETNSVETAFSRTPVAKDILSQPQLDYPTLSAKRIKIEPPTPEAAGEESSQHQPPAGETEIPPAEIPRSRHSSQTISAASTPQPVPLAEEHLPSNFQQEAAIKQEEQGQNVSPLPAPKTATTNQPPPKLHFYLHRPQTASKYPVLTPLSASASISDSLRGRTVLEFPTLYVLPWKAGELPGDKYLLEEEYLRENKDVDVDVGVGSGEIGDDGADGNLNGVDERKFLEVLQQDLQGP